MEITTMHYKHCELIKPSGRVDSQTAPQLAEALDAITNAGHFKIVIDMSEVEFMSSAGLRVLINTQKNCKRFNRGEVILATVPQRIYEALDLAGFIPLFAFFDDVTTAVGHF
ncbi:MAG: anti-sigma factor antagonist [Chloroflexi bacterium]|jgi:anti-sigma B factor antagonist|nr:anti-sigma factor antagonist [Chloroflexota bacterium]